MNVIFLILPPWLFAVLVTLIGRWGERHFAHVAPRDSESSTWISFVSILLANLVFLALLPISVLTLFGPLLPFFGARSGLALAIVVLLFGLVPARLIDATNTGWNFALWSILVDIVRVGGTLTLIGGLLSR